MQVIRAVRANKYALPLGEERGNILLLSFPLWWIPRGALTGSKDLCPAFLPQREGGSNVWPLVHLNTAVFPEQWAGVTGLSMICTEGLERSTPILNTSPFPDNKVEPPILQACFPQWTEKKILPTTLALSFLCAPLPPPGAHTPQLINCLSATSLASPHTCTAGSASVLLPHLA